MRKPWGTGMISLPVLLRRVAVERQFSFDTDFAPPSCRFKHMASTDDRILRSHRRLQCGPSCAREKPRGGWQFAALAIKAAVELNADPHVLLLGGDLASART